MREVRGFRFGGLLVGKALRKRRRCNGEEDEDEDEEGTAKE